MRHAQLVPRISNNEDPKKIEWFSQLPSTLGLRGVINNALQPIAWKPPKSYVMPSSAIYDILR